MDILATLVSASPVLLPLVSALAGVLAGGLLSRSNEESKRLGELKREVILESLDQAYAMEDAMNTFTSNAPLGGTDPEADSRAGEAIGRAMVLDQEMRRMRGRRCNRATEGLSMRCKLVERRRRSEPRPQQVAKGVKRDVVEFRFNV